MKMDSTCDKLKSEPATNAQPKSSSVPKEVEEDKAVRRESMPRPNTSTVIKSSPSKSRILSPPKFAIKKLKVRVKRLKLDAHFLKNTQESAAAKKGVETSNVSPKNAIDHSRSPAKKTQQQAAPKVVTETNIKLKPCLVRLPRLSVQKLQEYIPVPVDYGSKKVQKRQSNSGSSSAETLHNRKGERGSEILELKRKTGFSIKINDLNKTPNEAVKNLKEKKYKTACAKYHHNINIPTKPKKCTRSQLIKQYGKRFFNSYVKIKRCKDPMMTSKKKKSKNLKVSFCEDVQVFHRTSSESSEVIFSGSSESEHESCEVHDQTSNLKSSVRGTMVPLSVSTVTPVRLQNVENGNVLDDIDLDTSLKLANEKMSLNVRQHLSAEDADDETEDDECEYIVPINFPERRSSRTSSANAAEEIILGQNAQQSPVAEFMALSTIPNTPVETQVSSVEQQTSEKLTEEKIGFNDIVSNSKNEGLEWGNAS